MWIDIIFLLCIIIGIWKGWQHGLIISLFTVAAWLLGILGAMKFCAMASVFLRDQFHIQSQYTPVISFIAVFLIIAFIVYLIGKALEKVFEIAQLGFINRTLGVILRCSIYIFIFSLFVWLINQSGFVSPAVKAESKTYNVLAQISQKGISFFEHYLPFVKSAFNDISEFFFELAKKSEQAM